MTKHDILEVFKDIDFMYNDSTRLDTLSRMIDELQEEQQDYRKWIIDMFHKHGRDELIVLMVKYGEENLLADMLKSQPQIVRCKDCKRRGSYQCPIHVESAGMCTEPDDWFCADGEWR